MGMHVFRTGIQIHVLRNRELVYVVDGTTILFCEDLGLTMDGDHLVLDADQNLLISRYVFKTHDEAIRRVKDNWFVLRKCK